jgi:hypothetical protein
METTVEISLKTAVFDTIRQCMLALTKNFPDAPDARAKIIEPLQNRINEYIANTDHIADEEIKEALTAARNILDKSVAGLARQEVTDRIVMLERFVRFRWKNMSGQFGN